MVSGSVTPLTLNPEPVRLIADTTTFAVPVLVTTTVFVLVVPTVALPKDSELGEIVADTVWPDPDPGSDTPVLPQPVIRGSANKTAMATACASRVILQALCFFTVPLTSSTFSESLYVKQLHHFTVSRALYWFNLNGPQKRYERRTVRPVLLTKL